MNSGPGGLVLLLSGALVLLPFLYGKPIAAAEETVLMQATDPVKYNNNNNNRHLQRQFLANRALRSAGSRKLVGAAAASRPRIIEVVDFQVGGDDDGIFDSKRFDDDYGHMRFGKRNEEKFDDYGHMRFGRKRK